MCRKRKEFTPLLPSWDKDSLQDCGVVRQSHIHRGKGTLSPAVDDAMRLTGEVVVKDFTIAISQKAHLQQGSGQAVEHFPTTVQDLLDADFLVTVIVDRRVITHQKRKAQTGFFLVGGAMMGI